MTTVAFQVDGKYLGYDFTFIGKTITDLGLLWKCQNGVDTHRALKLVLKRTGGSNSASFCSNSTPVGSAKATFFETIFFQDMVEQLDHDQTHCLNHSSASTPAFTSGAKKAFASVSGSTTVVTNGTSARSFRRRGRGRWLGEITIHYTLLHLAFLNLESWRQSSILLVDVITTMKNPFLTINLDARE